MSKPILGLYVACVVFGLWGLTHIYVESFHESLSYAILIISVVNFIALLSIGNVLRAIARILTHLNDPHALRDVQASMKYDICPHGIPRSEECGHCRRDDSAEQPIGPDRKLPEGTIQPTGTRNEFGKPFPVSYKHAFVGYDGCEVCGLGRENDIHDVPRGGPQKRES